MELPLKKEGAALISPSGEVVILAVSNEDDQAVICTAVNFHDRLVEMLKQHKETLNSCVQVTTDVHVSLSDSKHWRAKRDRVRALLDELKELEE